MIDKQNVASLIGVDVVGEDGRRIGKVKRIFVDPHDGRPNWATVGLGLLGTSESFFPLTRADAVDGGVRVPYTRDFIKNAPRTRSSTDLSDEVEAKLREYYEQTGAGPTPPG